MSRSKRQAESDNRCAERACHIHQNFDVRALVTRQPGCLLTLPFLRFRRPSRATFQTLHAFRLHRRIAGTCGAQLKKEKGTRQVPVPSSETSQGGLASLFELDYFLIAVLGYLVEHGLHECRRACRKWRDVCNKLPVRLRVPEEKIPVAAEKFPNAISVASVRDCYDFPEKRVQISELKEADRDAPWFSFLSKFRKMERLQLQSSLWHNTEIGPYPFRALIVESAEKWTPVWRC